MYLFNFYLLQMNYVLVTEADIFTCIFGCYLNLFQSWGN